MNGVWEDKPGLGWAWGLIGSVVLHAVLALGLFMAPAEARNRLLSTVDFQVEKRLEKPEPSETKPPPVEPPDEKELAKTSLPKAKKAAQEPVPEPQVPPPKPPPKFQMSGETFAQDGSWSLAAEIGDNRFGAVDGVGKPDPEKKSEAKEQLQGTGLQQQGVKKGKEGFSAASPDQVKSKPKVLLEKKIPYPAEARKLAIQGKVRLRVYIDEKGKVVKVDVLDDPGGGLGEAAAEALEQFVFAPAIGLDDEPVDYRITYVYVFELD